MLGWMCRTAGEVTARGDPANFLFEIINQYFPEGEVLIFGVYYGNRMQIIFNNGGNGGGLFRGPPKFPHPPRSETRPKMLEYPWGETEVYWFQRPLRRHH